MTIKRLAHLLALAISIVFCASSAGAQQSQRVFRVGILSLQSAPSVQPRVDVFRETLHKLGYDKNLIIESRFANGAYDQLPVLAGELARLKVDVFLALGEPALLAAKERAKIFRSSNQL